MSRTAEATLRVAPPAGTSLSGQLVQLDGAPIPNTTVRVGSQKTLTDAGGNFLLKHLKVPKPKPGAKYQHEDYVELVLILDGRTARAAGGHLYPVFEKLLEYGHGHLYEGRANKFVAHPHHHGRVYIPTLDPRNAATVDPSRDTVLRFPHLPGLEITVPAGTTLRDIDGRPTRTINVAETPLHLAQMHLQHLPPGVGASALLSLQLGGTTASKPLQVTVPNRGNLPPGKRVALYFYDVTQDGWFSPGQGTVSDDGTKIVPDPGAGITRLGCVIPPAFGADPGADAK